MNMAFTWYLNVFGLLVSTIAAWMMFRYPMDVPSYNPDGTMSMPLCTDTVDHANEHKVHNICSKSALILLIAGFALQFLGSFLQIWWK
jgi:hypothetical protein